MRRHRASSAVAIMSALSFVTASAQAQQPPAPAACDTDKDGFIDERDFKLCAEQDFRNLVGGRNNLTLETYGNVDQSSEPRPSFTDLDINQDGKITLEEFGSFYGERFKGAASMSGGRMSTDEYASWREGGVTSR